MDYHAILQQAQGERVSDGALMPIVDSDSSGDYQLVLVWPQLGDFDSLEYAWWLQREADQLPTNLRIRAVGIGDRASGQQFCQYTGFPPELLWVDPGATLHGQLGLYPGLTLKVPGFSHVQNAYVNLLLMCAGIGSPGTLAEVFRGYRGDKQAPQLIDPNTVVQAPPLPPIQGSFFNLAGGKGFNGPLNWLPCAYVIWGKC
jgi:hypothetical protein